jgi:hypothetical protein
MSYGWVSVVDGFFIAALWRVGFRLSRGWVDERWLAPVVLVILVNFFEILGFKPPTFILRHLHILLSVEAVALAPNPTDEVQSDHSSFRRNNGAEALRLLATLLRIQKQHPSIEE